MAKYLAIGGELGRQAVDIRLDHRCRGPEYADHPASRQGRRGLDRRNCADDGQVESGPNRIESNRRSRIAGDDDESGIVAFGKPAEHCRNPRLDRGRTFGPVGITGIICGVDNRRCRQCGANGPQDGKPADTGIEDEKGPGAGHRRACNDAKQGRQTRLRGREPLPYPEIPEGDELITFETLFQPVAALVLGYLLGSIPFGLLLTRVAGLGDIRSIGSGNIGATNVLRTGNKGLAAATLVLDALKGAAAVVIVRWLWPDNQGLPGLAAISAFLGHLYPVWLRFRGGKGVATLLGIVSALFWPAALAAAIVWIAALLLTRFSSVGGMAAAVTAPVAAGILGRLDLAILFTGFALLVIWKHRANIGRLIKHTEPKVGKAG